LSTVHPSTASSCSRAGPRMSRTCWYTRVVNVGSVCPRRYIARLGETPTSASRTRTSYAGYAASGERSFAHPASLRPRDQLLERHRPQAVQKSGGPGGSDVRLENPSVEGAYVGTDADAPETFPPLSAVHTIRSSSRSVVSAGTAAGSERLRPIPPYARPPRTDPHHRWSNWDRVDTLATTNARTRLASWCAAMGPSPQSCWTTWGTVSSGFREIELRRDRLGPVGDLAPFLAPGKADAPAILLDHDWRMLTVRTGSRLRPCRSWPGTRPSDAPCGASPPGGRRARP
jgi:hypothetical protein